MISHLYWASIKFAISFAPLSHPVPYTTYRSRLGQAIGSLLHVVKTKLNSVALVRK
jgi:hypothetical protein